MKRKYSIYIFKKASIWNDSPPTKGSLARWFGFMVGGPTIAVALSYYQRVYPIIVAKRNESK